MNANTSVEQPNGKSDISGAILIWLAKVGGFILITAASLFISSGRLDWVTAWAYIGASVVCQAVAGLILIPNSPELILERAQKKENAKKWDRVLVGMVQLGQMGTWIVAGLDERFGWSPQLALAIQLVALVLVVLGYGPFYWAMASNVFFSSLVRIQKERGHTVATGGPYRYVRHPGYVGYITSWLATSLALGSLWALIPAGLVMCLMIIRTVLEDRTLLEELDGYRDYAGRVHYRLLPGIW